MPSPNKKILVSYFALFRERAGRSEETIQTHCETTADLYRELSERHALKLASDRVKVALNAEFTTWNARLRDGDHVVFIPPVAGG